MPSITLSKIEKQSKGRNGWFNPARAAVKYGPGETLCVEIWSKRETGEPPIDLYLTKADAGALAMLLMDGAMDNLNKRDTEAEFIQARYGSPFSG